MDLKLCLLIFISKLSTQAKLAENPISRKSDEPPMTKVFANYNDADEDEEDFLDIDDDLDYFYTYEAIKRLEDLTPRQNDSNATIDLAEKFFLNFETEYEDYSYEDYEDNEQSTDKPQTNTDYIELDEIEHDDFVYFTLDTMEDTVGQSRDSRDIILIIVLLGVTVLGAVFLLVICLLKSRRQPGELSTGNKQEEKQIKKDSLLAEAV